MLESFWTSSRQNFNQFTHSTIFSVTETFNNFSRFHSILGSNLYANHLTLWTTWLLLPSLWYSPYSSSQNYLISTQHPGEQHPHTCKPASSSFFISRLIFPAALKILSISSSRNFPRFTFQNQRRRTLCTSTSASAAVRSSPGSTLFIYYLSLLQASPSGAFSITATTLITIQTDFCCLINLLSLPHSLSGAPFHIHQPLYNRFVMLPINLGLFIHS